MVVVASKVGICRLYFVNRQLACLACLRNSWLWLGPSPNLFLNNHGDGAATGYTWEFDRIKFVLDASVLLYYDSPSFLLTRT